MSAKGFLDQLLRTAQSTLESGGLAQRRPDGGLSPSDFGKGALTGGALGLLLGNKRVRKLGGSAVKYGGLAALGALAYKAYGDWQASQASAQSAPQGQPVPPPPPPAQIGHSVERLPAALPDDPRSLALLSAIVAAAKADGHVDAAERARIEDGLGRLADAEGLRGWLQAELAKPLDPAQIAALADTPELAAEVYMTSVVMVDEQSFMERAYLDELARQLALAPELKARLEQQVAQGVG